jgi:hypothetical protein
MDFYNGQTKEILELNPNNSKAYKKGNATEYGISGQPLKKIRTSPRIDQKIKTKYNNDPNVKGKVIEKDMPNRKDALEWEQGKVNEYNKEFKEPPQRQQRPLPSNE